MLAPHDGARAGLLGAVKDETERVRDADRTFHRETRARAREVERRDQLLEMAREWMHAAMDKEGGTDTPPPE